MVEQAILPFSVSDETSFNSFFRQGNEALLQELFCVLDGNRAKRVIYLWGEQGSGKTHLLNACCYHLELRSQGYLYLPIEPGSGRVFDLGQVQDCALVCVDDVQNLVGNQVAQEAIFSLYEKVMSQWGAMIVSGTLPPAAINFELRDLQSRLMSGGVFALQKLTDDAKVAALKFRAQKRGFDLEDRVVDFIMTHYDRNTSALFALLERIDRTSLAEHRKITVPFIKTLL